MSGEENVKYSQVEKWKFPRLKSCVEIRYSVLGIEDKQDTSMSLNVSLGGLCMRIPDKFEPGTVLDLRIFLPEKADAISAQGRIIWVQDIPLATDKKSMFEMGLQFTKIEDRDCQVLKQYIAETTQTFTS